MDTVTYPDAGVRAELAAAWLEYRVDVTERKAVAELFEIAAIPTGVLMDVDGGVLDRVVGFVEPGDFVKRLEGVGR